MSEPITNVEAAVAELGALPMPAGPGSHALSAEQRASLALLIGDAKPANAKLLNAFGEAVRDCRNHEHPKASEDFYCLNLAAWMGERVALVLRRLLDAEAQAVAWESAARKNGELYAAAENQRDEARARVAELEAEQQVVFLASRDGRLLGLYGQQEDALHHCEAAVQRGEYRSCPISWRKRADETCELFAWTSREVEGSTGFVVTPVEVRPEFDEGWGEDADEPSEVSADKLTRLLAPSQALREDEPAEAPQLTVFRASHDSIVMGLYTTAAEARKHCETLIGRDWPNCNVDWLEDDEDGVAELTVWVGGEERTTGYVVTGLEIASEYDEEADE
jgi:hypothetical protein